MKIAFVGKGGSGKTTVSALFCRYISTQGMPLIALDADINQHMAQSLGATETEAHQIPAMGLGIDRIKSYLRGSNPLIKSNHLMAKTTPPGTGSRLVKIQENNPIYDYFSREIGGVRLLAVGPFSEDDLGVSCYHSKTGAAELLLSHMIDGENEYLVMDMTAGADSFASGMFTKFDVTFLVVEPTSKSISVYKQYKEYARDHNITIKVVANKVENSEDVDFIRKVVANDLVAVFWHSDYVRKMEKGDFQDFNQLENENIEALEQIKMVTDMQKKDNEKLYHHTVEFHILNAKSWANNIIGEDLTKQIDPAFTFPQS